MKSSDKISLIGAASGWGAKNKGTEDGPIFVKKTFLEIQKTLKENDVNLCWSNTIISTKMFSNYCNDLSFLEREELILDICKKLSQQVVDTIKDKSFPIIIGGDHSLAIGTWHGIAKAYNCYENLGLIWFDAHMDSHTLETTVSQAIHGMPLALLTGHGSSRIIEKLFNYKKIINPKHLVLIGVRSFEIEEKLLLNKLGVKIYYMKDISRKGLKKIFLDSIDYLSTYTDSIGISIDLDVFDPCHVPATGCQEKNGILPQDFLAIIKQINFLDIFVALEIMEFNPHLDKDCKTINFINDIIKYCAINNKP